VVATSPTARTEIVAFRSEHLELVARFSARVWPRRRSLEFLRWRYLEHPDHRAYLALREGECIAMVGAFRRPYRVGERTILVAEAFDWYCLPDLRGSGLGVRLLQRLMKDAEPVIVTGGTADTRNLLPRMHYQIPASVLRFGALLGADRASALIAGRTHLPRPLARLAYLLSQPLLGPRVRKAPKGGKATAVAKLGEEALAIDPRPGARGSTPIWTAEYLAWLAAASPALGRYVPLEFRVGASLVGWALLRSYEIAGGRDAALVDVRARVPSDEIYTWMISEIAVRARAEGCGLLLSGTSCPHVVAGMRANRFFSFTPAPIHYFAQDGATLEAPVVFGAHWGDEPILPYPTSAW
jgi:GNAT superfamily N-acetyltransferase